VRSVSRVSGAAAVGVSEVVVMASSVGGSASGFASSVVVEVATSSSGMSEVMVARVGGRMRKTDERASPNITSKV
jgi:hypothetical protein